MTTRAKYSAGRAAIDHLGDSLEPRFPTELLGAQQEQNYHTSSRTTLDFGAMTGDFWLTFKSLPESIASHKPFGCVQATNGDVQNEGGSDRNNPSLSLVGTSQIITPGLTLSQGTRVKSANVERNDYLLVPQMNEMKLFDQGMQSPQHASLTDEAREEVDSSGSEVVQKYLDEYLEEQSLSLKQLLRRENNRAAARRSNIRKKLEKEARKKELATLKKMELELRAKDVRLRQENLWLRALVYSNGHNA